MTLLYLQFLKTVFLCTWFISSCTGNNRLRSVPVSPPCPSHPHPHPSPPTHDATPGCGGRSAALAHCLYLELMSASLKLRPQTHTEDRRQWLSAAGHRGRLRAETRHRESVSSVELTCQSAPTTRRIHAAPGSAKSAQSRRRGWRWRWWGGKKQPHADRHALPGEVQIPDTDSVFKLFTAQNRVYAWRLPCRQTQPQKKHTHINCGNDTLWPHPVLQDHNVSLWLADQVRNSCFSIFLFFCVLLIDFLFIFAVYFIIYKCWWWCYWNRPSF